MLLKLQERFGRHLAAHRKRLGWKQAQLAEAADISTHMLAKLETGKAAPSFATIERLSGALGIDAAELLTHELPGRPYERRALTSLVAELAPLGDDELLWLRDIIRAALNSRR